MACKGNVGGFNTIGGSMIELGGKLADRAKVAGKAFTEAVEENIHTAGEILDRSSVHNVSEFGANLFNDIKETPPLEAVQTGVAGRVMRSLPPETKDNLKDIYKITLNNPTIKAAKAFIKGTEK